MDGNNFGSFGNVSPDAMQAIREALARRQQGGGVPALNQQSGASPTQAPMQPQAPSGATMPQPNQPAPEPTPKTEPQAVSPTDAEAKLIVQALKERLSTLNKIIAPQG